MKKTITLFISLFIISFVFADGLDPLLTKPLSGTSTTYSPDPNSADIGNAFNIYAGLGSVHGSNFGFSVGADYEFPIIDPNLTFAPQVIIGFYQYGLGYWDPSGYQTGTSQISFSGGIAVRYYADWLIPNMPEQFDVFVMSTIGFGYTKYGDYYDNDIYFSSGYYVGGRWNFSEAMSLYAQVGSGANSISAGLSWKL